MTINTSNGLENDKKILIVEDETPLRNALRDKLIHEGYVVLEAKNGEEGLESALRDHPDLILLDIVMPRMDGMTVLGKLRQDAWGADVKVIILTNLSEVVKVSEVMARGSFSYLVKSDWKLEEVVIKVKEVLGK